MPLRAIELFSGIGGFAAAVADRDVRVVAAMDQDPAALATYRLNFPDHPCRQVDLERITPWELTSLDADLWWLSPPCQPYCERGARRDLDDHRAQSFVHIMEILERISGELLPGRLALENVAGFVGSQAHGRLLAFLEKRGYGIRERLVCPTELGIPSRRPRYYLAASLSPLAPLQTSCPPPPLPLSACLDPSLAGAAPAELLLADDILARFGDGFRILDPADPAASTTCFTSGYGRSLMHAGSYLRCGTGVRRFTPEEIVRLLRFPEWFRFPGGMSLRRRWSLAGNSLSVVVVREVLGAFSELAGEG